jgi:ribosomal protein S4
LIIFLETRLNVILLRLAFCSKLLQANKHIVNNNVFVNDKLKNSNYILRNGDILNLNETQHNFLMKKRFKNLL